ncbi:MAG TPA: hypothetical protein VN868_10475 [Terriglobales bacterium]|nr:hypothetical protein [Terriglobales bacterium]
MNITRARHIAIWLPVLLLSLAAAPGLAQTCLTADDVDEPTRSALLSTAKRFYDMAAHGDSASLQRNAIASLSSNFSGIEAAIRSSQENLAGAQAVARPPFLLKAEGTEPLARAEFLCGVFGAQGQTRDSAVFVLPNLPPGNYSVVTLDLTTTDGAYTVSFVLQQQAGDWKLGGFYAKPAQIAGHDGNWFADRAREFKAKGQARNAWFYFGEARELLVPVPFVATATTDKLYDEMQLVKPADAPSLDLTAAGKTYKLTDLFPVPVGHDFDLVAKYQAADVSDSGLTFQNNLVVMKALLAKYPEFRDGFAGIVVRAVEPSGRDYGSMMAVKDIK